MCNICWVKQPSRSHGAIVAWKVREKALQITQVPCHPLIQKQHIHWQHSLKVPVRVLRVANLPINHCNVIDQCKPKQDTLRGCLTCTICQLVEMFRPCESRYASGGGWWFIRFSHHMVRKTRVEDYSRRDDSPVRNGRRYQDAPIKQKRRLATTGSLSGGK